MITTLFKKDKIKRFSCRMNIPNKDTRSNLYPYLKSVAKILNSLQRYIRLVYAFARILMRGIV